MVSTPRVLNSKAQGLPELRGGRTLGDSYQLSIEGRVVFADGTKPAAGAIIHAFTSKPRNNPPSVVQPFSQHRADARADSNGKYRIATPPAGSYDLLAEMPDWVNSGEQFRERLKLYATHKPRREKAK